MGYAIIIFMNLTYDRNEFYRMHLAKDLRFDGKFFVAVKTTRIYGRPICPWRAYAAMLLWNIP